MELETNALVGAAIRREREKIGITQDELAQRLGLSRPSIANIERGRQQISVAQLVNFSRALGTLPSELLPVYSVEGPAETGLEVPPLNATPRIMEWAEKLISGRG